MKDTAKQNTVNCRYSEHLGAINDPILVWICITSLYSLDQNCFFIFVEELISQAIVEIRADTAKSFRYQTAGLCFHTIRGVRNSIITAGVISIHFFVISDQSGVIGRQS